MFGLSAFYAQKINELRTILDGFAEGITQQLVSGLSGSAKSLWIASMFDQRSGSLIAVTHNLYQGQKLYNDLAELVAPEALFLYPTNDLIAADIAVASPELLAQRIDVLNHLAAGEKCLVVVPAAGIKRLLAPPFLWKTSLIRFKSGEVVDLEDLIRKLTAIGYERGAMVTGPGQFSLRGGIIDIFPLTEEHPLRIELFDDEVDSIRFFDSETQRSLDMLQESPVIGPAKEYLLYDEVYDRAARSLDTALSATLSRVGDPAVRDAIDEHIGADIEKLKQHEAPQNMGRFSALLYSRQTTLTDYVPADTLLIFDEISRIQEMMDQLDREEAEWQVDMLQKGEMVNDVPLTMSWPDLSDRLKQPLLLLSLFLRYHGQFQPQNIVNLNCRSMQDFHGQINLLKTETSRWMKSEFAVVFLASSPERAKRLEQVLQDYGIDAETAERGSAPVPGHLQVVISGLENGFELPLQRLAVVTEKEVFTKKSPKTQHRGRKISNAERLKNYNELKTGDYVVHVDHGIGRYAGIQTLEVNGVHKDYLEIIYKGNDKLFVPVEHIGQVQKYVGSEGKEPKIYSLGGSEWKKVKSKAKSSVQDIADDLIKLYAKREASRGHAFAKDGPAQRAFEAAFPYQETADQIQAIDEIKKDMEKEKPMDRLLCGDVGYGKTEVALRAAFKAIEDGKQVAFLVPTTILAQQHYETSMERFEDFPVSIGVLSRFRTHKEQLETLRGLKAGTIDMVIGTHRLLSKDVVFKDLGLLIVDEEQRFGVTHKEKIKRLKANVDVLTLTATPIPRTLHMSIMGVRDLSIIETPPENRFPVQTYVTEYNETLVREAIEREMARGGQVYFLYNRVESIQRMADLISTLVPDASVTFAHGQMKESELEAAMIDFLDGTADVLVSTTIIEEGVDIPNVNTLIVYDADKMGLAQLYQLRGRVGRSNRVAYAYFTYQRDKVMNEVAEKRLQAIKEFTELGSGFKIAMRDLSIRGAGNLLGAQQHGFMDSVGFDLYSQMLKDAVRKRQGVQETLDRPVSVSIEMDVDAYIPDSYIGDSLQKIDMYKRFQSVDTLQSVRDLEDELIDRYGSFPEEVSELLKVATLRVIANQLRIEEIKQNREGLAVTFSEQGWGSLNRESFFKQISRMDTGIAVGSSGSKVKISIKTKDSGKGRLLEAALKTLKVIAKTCRKAEKAG
ncbi:transcription-repair coupling factor [Sporolactobacillus vineae]|uniref:transcription-repair coupling factor n=1 Tax=Sporolactobacillus vineae TaxID=444463 RepID=UPI000287A56B|nr:transcription-repair coupling factor [Sporolactobacillus vineae]